MHITLYGRLTVSCAAICLAARIAPAAGQAACAVIPASGSRSTIEVQLAELVQARLSGESGVQLVERASFQSIINEQMLSAAFSSEGVQSRVRLGRLIRADFLLFIRERAVGGPPDEKEPKESTKKAVELVVSETNRGLRLIRSTAVSDPSQVEQTAGEWAQLFGRARELAGHADLKVFGVPAFECKDVMGDYASLRRGMALLVEECLLASPGMVAVELTEAQTLAREAAIGGQAVSRNLPYYLVGWYKTSREGQHVTFEFTVELKHGESSVASATRKDVESDRLGDALQDALKSLLAKAGGLRSGAPASEVKTLLQRAEVFRSLVEWDEALPLYESVLLLDPNNVQAHLQSFEGYLALAYTSSRNGGPGYDPAVCMERGETALMHASALLRRGEVTRGILERLGQLTVMFHQVDPTRRYREGRWRRAVDGIAGDAMSFLDDPQRMAKLDKKLRSLAVDNLGSVIDWANMLAPPDDWVARRVKLLIQLDRLDATFSKLFRTAVHSVPRGRLPEVCAQLEENSSQRLRQVAHLGRLFLQASDENTRQQAIEQAKAYLAAQGLPEPLIRGFESESQERINATARLNERNGTTQPADNAGVFLPRLTKISDRWRMAYPDGKRIDGAPYVYDWLLCSPGQEILVLSQGLYRLTEGNTLQLVASLAPGFKEHPMRHQAAWDGRYIWLPVDKPQAMIVVVDPHRGEVARFDEAEVVQGSKISDGELLSLRAGQAFYFGSLRKEAEPVRNWAMLLEIESQSDGTMRKRFERIYEARETTTPNTKERIGSASPLYWAIRVPCEGESGGPLVLAKTWKSGTIVFDISQKTARAAKASWPPDCPVCLDRRLLLPSGHISFVEQESKLQWSDHPDHASKDLIDWGKRPNNSNIGSVTFFRAAVMYQGLLHLLARGDAPCSPAWIAVDPHTWQTRILVDQFPRGWPRRSMERLCVTERDELIFISSGNAYKVELPPVETWPVMKAQIRGPGPLRPATKPG